MWIYLEQELIDCGNPWVYKIGLQTEKSYPYEGKSGPCRAFSNDIAVRISGLKAVKPFGDEDVLKHAVALKVIGKICWS